MPIRSQIRSLRHRPLWPAAALACGAAVWLAAAPAAQQAPAPAPATGQPTKILLDTSPRAVEYQLARLTNAELASVERKDTDPRYRPVYFALLTRKGVPRQYSDEALAALVKLDKSSPSRVLMEALAKVAPADDETADRLVRALLGQPAATLRAERNAFAQALDTSTSPLVWRGAYGALIAVDGSADQALALAAKHQNQLAELLRAVPSLPSADVRAKLADPVAAQLKQSADPATRTAALTALAAARPDAATFTLLAAELTKPADPASRTAALQALRRFPKAQWPAAELEPLARAVIGMVKEAPPNARTTTAVVDAAHFVESLAEAMPAEAGRAVRRDLRAVSVQVVRVGTIPEQMTYDLRWFAVEAGKAVQIVFTNPDAMTHNFLLGRPGSLKEIGNAAMTMSVPTDPNAKPYVPDSPNVLQATRLLNWGESERLNFTAPAQPGDYIFVCTFPGHWVRMYGVMLVVDNLDAWEAKRTVPNDPMTGKPFPSQRVVE